MDNLVQVLPPRMFSSLQEEMTSRVREGRRRKKAQKQSDDEDELNTSDCEVFQCGAASVGHLAYRSHLDLKEKKISTFKKFILYFTSPPNCPSGCTEECQT